VIDLYTDPISELRTQPDVAILKM